MEWVLSIVVIYQTMIFMLSTILNDVYKFLKFDNTTFCILWLLLKFNKIETSYLELRHIVYCLFCICSL
jgi:hypothetical protein